MLDTIAQKGWGGSTHWAIHIGLIKKEGHWQWPNSGKILTDSSRWASGQPSGDGTCASLWFGRENNGRWNDAPCHQTAYQGKPVGAICEHDGGSFTQNEILICLN